MRKPKPNNDTLNQEQPKTNEYIQNKPKQTQTNQDNK